MYFCWKLVIFNEVLHELSIFSYKCMWFFNEFVYIFDWILGFICHVMKYFNFLYVFSWFFVKHLHVSLVNVCEFVYFFWRFYMFFSYICISFACICWSFVYFLSIFIEICLVFMYFFYVDFILKVFACVYGWFYVLHDTRSIISCKNDR